MTTDDWARALGGAGLLALGAGVVAYWFFKLDRWRLGRKGQLPEQRADREGAEDDPP